jgi:hypothetical protein
MSVAIETTFDVFLSYSERDRGAAELVRHALANAGLEAFCLDRVEVGGNSLSEVRRALAECSAVLFLLTGSSIRSQNVAFETGMALAWNKPIYVLFDGLEPGEIPDYLQEFHVRRLSEMDDVVQEIAASRQPLSRSERDNLIDLYSELAIPTDQLLRKPIELKGFAAEFLDRTGKAIPGERLVQELLRLRKQSQLPRLRRE